MFAEIALKTAVISGAVIGATTFALPLMGFGALGPIAGSYAAAYQSTYLGGTIASSSIFAALESVGMAGLSIAAKTSIIGGSAVIATATNGKKKKKKKKAKKSGTIGNWFNWK